MRPRKLRRIVAASASGIVLFGSAVGFGVREATAETGVMVGVLGIAPNYRSLKLCPCQRITHPVMPWSVPQIEKRIEQWAAAPVQAVPEPKRLVTFSLSTVAALQFLEENPDSGVEVVALGSPETPGSHRRDRRYTDETVPAASFIALQYDPIVDEVVRPNFYAAINSRMSTHIKGYDQLDLDSPDAVHVTESGAEVKWFRSDTLPMLRWRESFTTPERMAELDAKYRPLIEKAYDRPVDLEDSWNQGRGSRRNVSDAGGSKSAAAGGSSSDQTEQSTQTDTTDPSNSSRSRLRSGTPNDSHTTKRDANEPSSDGGDNTDD